MEKLKEKKRGWHYEQRKSGLLGGSLVFIGVVAMGFSAAPEVVSPKAVLADVFAHGIAAPAAVQKTDITSKAVASKANLIIKLENVRNGKGKIRLALYKGADGYPDQSKKAERLVSVQAKKGLVEVVVEDLSKGDYAVALLHDENENGEMDMNLVGYPKEGYGFSNNNLPAFRAPRYDEAVFKLEKSKQELAIRIRY